MSKITQYHKFLGTGNYLSFVYFNAWRILIIDDTIGHSFQGYGFPKIAKICLLKVSDYSIITNMHLPFVACTHR